MEDFQLYKLISAYPSGIQSTLIFCASDNQDLNDLHFVLRFSIFQTHLNLELTCRIKGKYKHLTVPDLTTCHNLIT